MRNLAQSLMGIAGAAMMAVPLAGALPVQAQSAAETETPTTLQEVISRGRLTCGVNANLAGFASVDANQVWSGFEVEFCRALAAAVLGDPSLVDVVALPALDRFVPLREGQIDVIARASGWSLLPDVQNGVNMVATSFYDQLGFLVPASVGITSGKELDDSVICHVASVAVANSLDDYFRAAGLSYTTLVVQSDQYARQSYLSDECDSYARTASELYAVRASFETPSDHLIISEASTRLPSGPVVREGDDDWGDVVRWTFHALLAAEELGVTSANVREMAANPVANPETNRLLGTEGNFGQMLGLRPQWAVDAIAAGGNYAEIFERHIGESTPVGIARGLNAIWTRGGLQYAPPFR